MAALTPVEIRTFFPDPLWAQVRKLTGQFAVLDPAEISAEAFHRVLETSDPEVLVACWKTPPLPETLPPRLRYVCYLTGSVRRLVSPAHLESGLQVTNWGGSISRVVAEGTLFHILACLRRSPAWCLSMHTEGGWKGVETETASLFGRKVGLHGFGEVARELVKLLRAFSVEVQVFAPDVTPTVEQEWGVSRAGALDELFAWSDVVVEMAPLIPETFRIVREHHLRLLREGGVFVNTGRGDLVDEEGLVRVALEGKIQFGLDVFSVEPLPPVHPLRGLRNVSLTPHLAGPTTDRRLDAGTWALRNLQAYAEGRPLDACITTKNCSLKA